MTKSIRIVSDGTSFGTAVYSESGEKIGGVVRIEINPVECGGLVTATLTFVCVDLDIAANVEAE